MTPRQLRRAAERRTRKQERKAVDGFVFSPEDAAASPIAASPLPCPEPPLQAPEPPARSAERSDLPDLSSANISPAQLAANRANAQLSCGPKTPDGKAISSLNAVKTALTGRTVLLPSDDAARYENHIHDYLKELQPVGFREQALVQALADTAWRLDRIPALEMAIYAQGRIQFAKQFESEEPAVQPGLIELHTYLAYEKQLRNLQLQEMRLRRQREKDTAELRRLQQERTRKEKENLQTAAGFYLTAKQDCQPFDPAEYGFDFSVEDIESYLKGVRAARLFNVSLKQEREHAKPRTAAA
jgi:hypothetical protein